MSTNARLYYAVVQMGVANPGSNVFREVHGLQSVGLTTNFTLDQIFEIGQIEIYENKEGSPEIQLTAQKVLDGYPLIYHLATQQAGNPSLAGRSRATCILGLSTFDDTKESASGNPLAEVIMSGMYVNSLSYTFNVDGSFTEDLTFQGQSKIWKTSNYVLTGVFQNNDSPYAITGSGGINQRQNFVWADSTNGGTTRDANSMVGTVVASVIPPDIDGITSSGTNPLQVDGSRSAHVQSISVSTDLNRKELFELGRKTPYFRSPQFPVPVNCSITTLMKEMDNVDAFENVDNLTNRTIKIKSQEGTFINLGTKNKLQSVDVGGGDTGGGEFTLTYNYVTQNTLLVIHPQDPVTAFRTPQ